MTLSHLKHYALATAYTGASMALAWFGSGALLG